MLDFETTLNGIEYKVRLLIEEKKKLQSEILALTEKNEELTELIKTKEKTIDNLKEENQILTIRNTLVQKGDSTEIKLKINQLIRNIDKSLALLADVGEK